jgi:ATP-dependent Clp protease protease subunit
MRERMVDILVAATGQTSERIRGDLDRDFILRGEAAVAYGVVDEIVTAREVVPITALSPGTDRELAPTG